jgi:hypothetical protein
MHEDFVIYLSFPVKAVALLIYTGLNMSRSFPACYSISCRCTTSSFKALFSSTVGVIVSKHHFWYYDVFSMLYNTMKDW